MTRITPIHMLFSLRIGNAKAWCGFQGTEDKMTRIIADVTCKTCKKLYNK